MLVVTKSLEPLSYSKTGLRTFESGVLVADSVETGKGSAWVREGDRSAVWLVNFEPVLKTGG